LLFTVYPRPSPPITLSHMSLNEHNEPDLKTGSHVRWRFLGGRRWEAGRLSRAWMDASGYLQLEEECYLQGRPGPDAIHGLGPYAGSNQGPAWCRCRWWALWALRGANGSSAHPLRGCSAGAASLSKSCYCIRPAVAYSSAQRTAAPAGARPETTCRGGRAPGTEAVNPHLDEEGGRRREEAEAIQQGMDAVRDRSRGLPCP